MGGLGTADQPLLRLAAHQRLAWAEALLMTLPLSADLVEEVARWLPPRAELCLATDGWWLDLPQWLDSHGGEDLQLHGSAEPAPEGVAPVGTAVTSSIADNLARRFPQRSREQIDTALERASGHAGRAAKELREFG